jgi:hypothetical protein
MSDASVYECSRLRIAIYGIPKSKSVCRPIIRAASLAQYQRFFCRLPTSPWVTTSDLDGYRQSMTRSQKPTRPLKKLVCEIKGYACLTGANALESMHTSIDLTVERI